MRKYANQSPQEGKSVNGARRLCTALFAVCWNHWEQSTGTHDACGTGLSLGLLPTGWLRNRGHAGPGSHPVLPRAERRAEGSQGPVRASHSQEERPRLGLVAGLAQVSGQPLRIPGPAPRAGQEVLNDMWVEGSGDALHQQPGVQEQGQKLLVTV